MPAKQRVKTKYAGVFYIEVDGAEGPERVYYIQYRRNGKLVEEKAGHQFKDDMTPARASGVRARRIDGKELPNTERRAAERAAKNAEAGRWTLTKLWESYMAHKPDLKSVNSDNGRFKRFLQPTLGSKQPNEIAPLDVDRIRLKMAKTYSAQTVKHVLILLKRIINYGVDKQLCAGLTFKVKAPKVDNEKTEFLSEDELHKVIEVLKTWPDRQTANMVWLAVLTGLRRGELYRLQWRDLDLERGFIFIRNPKGGKSQNIPLNAAAADVLKNHPKINKTYVFSHDDGRPYTERLHNYRQLWPLKEALGLPEDFRPLHGFRHQFASNLASSGRVDMYVLQRLLTHKSPQMTQRYAHLRDEALKAASEVAGEILGEAGKTKKEVSDAS